MAKAAFREGDTHEDGAPADDKPPGDRLAQHDRSQGHGDDGDEVRNRGRGSRALVVDQLVLSTYATPVPATPSVTMAPKTAAVRCVGWLASSGARRVEAAR